MTDPASAQATPAPPDATPGLPPLYRRLEVATPQAHGALRLRDAGHAHARGVAALAVAVEEIALVGRHLPIVFADQAPHLPVLLMSLADGRPGPAIGPEGKWLAGGYVPIHLRRFPFLLVPSAPGTDQLVLCIDPTAPHCSTEDGDPIFDADGKPTAILQRAFALAREAEVAFRRAHDFATKLTQLGLLSPSTATMNDVPGATPSMQVTGFRAVDRAALGRLPPEDLAALRDAGFLEAIYAHLSSIQALATLAQPQVAAA